MPKVPYKMEKSRDDSEDYEIVSFEDFCDKPAGSKSDLLTLNDNINYRLFYESGQASKFLENGETSRCVEDQLETSLNTAKNVSFKEKFAPFAPFGKYSARSDKGSLLSGVIPKPRNEMGASAEPRYERFSASRNVFQRAWDNFPGVGSGMLSVALVCALCVAVWWCVGGAVGGAWGEEHYRRLWERAHPDNIKKPLSPMPYEKVLPEYRYHDHNNLSTKNKNISELLKKKEPNKKSDMTEHPELVQETCPQITENMRFDCYPQDGANEQDCVNRGCCWRINSIKNAPACYYPPHYTLYRFLNMSENSRGISVYYEKIGSSGYPGDINTARLDVIYLNADSVQIKIVDAEHDRFEPPYPEIPVSTGYISSPKYRVQVESAFFGFKVIRTKDNVTIVDTQEVGGLILSDKFLQISLLLPTDHLYGLGEKRARFLLDMNYNTITMFNSDQPPTENKNLYGTQPFYMAVEKNGMTHGLVFLNSNAMDAVLQPSPAITFRTIGGIVNMIVLLGPTPNQVVSQYSQLVGLPFMPPYWALGFHLCKFEYGGLNGTERVWQTNRDAGIPFDVQWNDIDYMDHRNDFTYDKNNFKRLPEFVKKVHDAGMHYVIILDPGVNVPDVSETYPPYDRGLEMDVFVKNSSNLPMVGKVWNSGHTVFPDFTHPNTTQYWTEMMRNFHKHVPYDGIWIDMNEPSNFVDGTVFGECAPEELPYRPRAIERVGLRHKTLCMDARHYAGYHYDWHSLYSFTEAIATNFALMEIRGKRPFIISRSTFVGMGRYSGHWSGDISSDWHSLKMTIPELVNYNMFGIPMMGADICGFGGNTSLSLCRRWTQLGAFYPFSRNHNSDNSIPQDPVSLGPQMVQIARQSLRTRYALLPLYYTLLWRAHVWGEPLIRALVFQYPEDPETHSIDSQFLIGAHIMIAPVLEKDATSTKAYLPGNATWFDFATAASLGNGWKDISEDQILLIQAGAIIITQEVPTHGAITTTVTRSCPLHLYVATDADRTAQGEIYWDDGDSLNSYEEQKYSHVTFKLDGNKLTSDITNWGYGIPTLNKLTAFNQVPVSTVTIDGVACKSPCRFYYVPQNKTLHVDNMNLMLNKPFIVQWN